MPADDRSSRSDVFRKGAVRHRITGPSRQGEEGVLRVSRLLVEQLNAQGARWSEPVDVSADRQAEGVDCQATDGRDVLCLQVTRADGDQELWRRLGQLGEVVKHTDQAEAVEALRASIERKAGRLPEVCRADITLVLDATDMPALVRTPAQLFTSWHGPWARALGFQSIWIVGPQPGQVARLDADSPGHNGHEPDGPGSR